MKRLLALLVCLALAMSFPALGLAMNDGAVVNNPNPADRLHLRQEPSASSASLGKYYNGTPVTVLEYREDGWQKVGIGYLGDSGSGESYQRVGYMMKQFLTHVFNGAEKNVKSAMPDYMSTAGQWELYSQPDKSSAHETYGYGKQVRLMGFTGDWWHVGIVQDGDIGRTGFVPAKNSMTSSYYAAVNNPNAKDRLHLRTGSKATATSLGKYFNGVKVQVLSFHGEGLWAKVRIGGTEGYMMSKYLLFGNDVDRVKSVIPTVRLTTDKVNLRETASSNGKVLGQYALGTSVKVWGVGETWLHVEVGGKSGYMMASMLSKLPGEGTGDSSQPVSGKAAKLKADANFRDSAGYTGTVLAYLGKGTKVTIQSQSGDWYRVRIGTTDAYGWILKSLVSIE